MFFTFNVQKLLYNIFLFEREGTCVPNIAFDVAGIDPGLFAPNALKVIRSTNWLPNWTLLSLIKGLRCYSRERSLFFLDRTKILIMSNHFAYFNISFMARKLTKTLLSFTNGFDGHRCVDVFRLPGWRVIDVTFSHKE